MTLNAHGGNIYVIARKTGIATRNLLDFSANINPLGFSPRIKNILRHCDQLIRNYPDRECLDLIHTISRYHGIPAASILVGNGSTEFIFLLPRVLKPKKTLLVIPTFSEYEAAVGSINGKVSYFKTLESNEFAITVENLFKELRNGYDALYICNPNNPTGVLTDKEKLLEILNAALPLGTQVILDETFIDFNENQSLKDMIQLYENMYILRSMTKFFGLPGLRAGYIFSSKGNIAKLRAHQEPWTMNALAQYASIESLRDQQFIRKTICYLQSARTELITALSTIPCLKIFPSAANFLLLKLDESELYESLLQKGVIIRKCDSFKGLNEHFFRIAVRTTIENKKLVGLLRKFLMSSCGTQHRKSGQR